MSAARPGVLPRAHGPLPLIAAVALGGLVLSGISAWITASSSTAGASDWAAAGRAVTVAVPVLAGCIAWYLRPGDRFGPVLAGAGYATFMTTFGESDQALLYSIGRVSTWLIELLFIYLILSFPSGRLPARVDKALVLATAAVVAVLYVPTALVVDEYPTPSSFATCEGSACPSNALMAVDSEPAVVHEVIRPLREVLTVLIFLAVMFRITARVRNATPLERRTLSPVLAVAIARLFLLPLALVTRAANPDSSVVDAIAWALALAFPVLSISFLIGLLRWRLFVARSFATLGTELRGVVSPGELRSALADALGDPGLRLAFAHARGGPWLDTNGAAIDIRPPPGSGQCVTKVRDGDRVVAAIVHDAALRGQDQLMEGATAYTRMVIANGRLSARLEASLDEVRASRARLSEAADEERRRIERDLHDGAQQRLVALRIQLELAEELVAEDPERAAERLHQLGDDVEAALEDIRSLAHGIFPPLLADRGLGEALRAAALHSPVAASVRQDGIRRYPRTVESAVYFCCLEAMQNAAKHGIGAEHIDVDLNGNGALSFTVSDDGAGFDPASAHPGAGFHSMRDRLAAIDGQLTIESEPGHGTLVSGRVPIA